MCFGACFWNTLNLISKMLPVVVVRSIFGESLAWEDKIKDFDLVRLNLFGAPPTKVYKLVYIVVIKIHSCGSCFSFSGD
jgi:hypothetical protein